MVGGTVRGQGAYRRQVALGPTVPAMWSGARAPYELHRQQHVGSACVQENGWEWAERPWRHEVRARFRCYRRGNESWSAEFSMQRSPATLHRKGGFSASDILSEFQKNAGPDHG